MTLKIIQQFILDICLNKGVQSFTYLRAPLPWCLMIIPPVYFS
jgi:hypothetical protein